MTKDTDALHLDNCLMVGPLVDCGPCDTCGERGYKKGGLEERCGTCRGSGRILKFEAELSADCDPKS